MRTFYEKQRNTHRRNIVKRILAAALLVAALISPTLGEGLKLTHTGTVRSGHSADHFYVWDDGEYTFLYLHGVSTANRGWGDYSTRIQKKELLWLESETRKMLKDATIHKYTVDSQVGGGGISITRNHAPSGNWIKWKIRELDMDMSLEDAEKAVSILAKSKLLMSDIWLP